jgi:hypothetical protein
MLHLSRNIILLASIFLLLSGCSAQKTSNQSPNPTPSTTSLRQVLEKNELLVLLTDGALWLTDPVDQQKASIYTLKVGETPSSVNLDTFKLSPKKTHVIWYTADRGLFSLDIEQKQVTTPYKPTNWFNTHPYVAFMPDSNTAVLVDDEGKTLIFIDLTTNAVTKNSIPYPFGTVFKPSPNGQAFVFVSGFSVEATLETTYMFTSSDLSTQKQFVTQTEQVERNQIEWLADSSGIITIENESTLMRYSYENPQDSQVFYTLPNQEKITYVQRIEDKYYVASANQTWYVLDASGKLYARLPIDMVADLNSPNLIPFANSHFLVDEVFKPTEQERFHRLWLLSFKGEKKLVTPKFNEMYVEVIEDTILK